MFASRLGWIILQLLLVPATAAIIFYFFPDLWRKLLFGADVRNWTLRGWTIANATIVAVLLVIRFAPDVKQAWTRAPRQDRRSR